MGDLLAFPNAGPITRAKPTEIVPILQGLLSEAVAGRILNIAVTWTDQEGNKHRTRRCPRVSSRSGE